MAPTTLYLIRHGETVGSHERRYKGTIDVLLSPDGERQVEKTATALGSVPFSALYCSDLARAVRSADILGSPRSLPPQVEKAFRERHFGRWEGLTFDECRRDFPEEFAAWVANPLDASPVGGESTREVHARVIPVLEAVLRRHRGETVALVSHGGVNRVVLSHALGLPLENIFRIEQDFAAVNILEFYDDWAGVRLLNGLFWK